MEKNAVPQIYALMNAVMKGIGYIPKDKKNTQQNYSFRGIDDIYNACHNSLCENGVFIAPTVLSVDKEERATKTGGTLFFVTLKVLFRFYAPDGSFVETTTIGEAMDSADKAANKAQSAAYKYAVMQVFSIPTKELIDADQTTPEDVKSKKQVESENVQFANKQVSQPKPKSPTALKLEALWSEFEKSPTDINLIEISKKVAQISPNSISGFEAKAKAHIEKVLAAEVAEIEKLNDYAKL